MNLPEKIVYEEVEKEATTPMEEMEIKVVTEIEKVTPPLFHSKISDLPLKPTEFLVDGLFMKGQCLTGVVGPSNCGKTFFVLDMMNAYATGEKEWNGRKIYSGPGERKVAYLCSEGTDKILSRICGYLQEHGNKTLKDIDDKFFLLDFKTYANTVEDIHLINSKTLKAIRDSIRKQLGTVDMIAIDTFNGFYGGKENDPDSVGEMLANIGTYLSAEFDANVIFIHHTGVDAIGKKIEEIRPRGSTSFISRLDICIILNGNITYGTEGFVSKSRDSEKGIRFYILARKVEVKAFPLNSEGKATTTLVIQWNLTDTDIRKSIAEHEEKKDTPTPTVFSDFSNLQKAMTNGTLPFVHLEEKDYNDEGGQHYVFSIQAKDLKEYIKQNIVLPRLNEEEEDFNLDNQANRNKLSKRLSDEYRYRIENKKTGAWEYSGRFMGRFVKYGLLIPEPETKPTQWITKDRLDYGNQFYWYPWTVKLKEEIPQ